MKKFLKRVLPFMLLLSVFLSGCAQMPEPSDNDTSAPDETGATTPADSTTGGTSSDTVPDGLDLTGYTVVYPDNASELIRDIAKKLTDDINALGGEGLPLVSDKTADAGLEILVGQTSRETSSSVYMSKTSYVIKKIGNKLVVHAGCDIALQHGAEKLTSLLFASGGKAYLKLDEEFGIKSVANLGNFGKLLVANQKANELALYSLDLNGMTSISKSKNYTNIYGGGVKVRKYKGRDVIITACESNDGKMIDANTKNVLWYSNIVGGNCHSVELTPNGVLIFASTAPYDIFNDGCRLKFFNAEDAEKWTEVRFDDAHGVLYDPDTDLVFAIGANNLRAFKVGLGSDGVPTFSENTEYALTLPTAGAHDLQPVYGNPDRFWITTLTNVYQYSVSEKKLYTEYEGSELLYSVENIKGIASFDGGSIMYIYPNSNYTMENGIENIWVSKDITFLYHFNGKYYEYKLSDKDFGLYKIRPYDTDYQ